MTNTRRILTLLLVLSAMVIWTEPVMAARLAEVKAEAGATVADDSSEFKLSEQSAVEVNYEITKLQDDCSVQVRVYREQNGRWLVVSNVHRTTGSSKGSKPLTLPAGSYRIKVTAKNARYNVSVDN